MAKRNKNGHKHKDKPKTESSSPEDNQPDLPDGIEPINDSTAVTAVLELPAKSEPEPVVHAKAYMVYPVGSAAQQAGLEPARIDYACDASEAIRQYAAEHVGSGLSAQRRVSDFTYRAVEVLDRRPRTSEGALLAQLPPKEAQAVIDNKEVCYFKDGLLCRWPKGKQVKI